MDAGPRSVSRKLTWMNMLVSGGALLLACAGFIAYDLASFRSVMASNLQIRALITGANSVSALKFDDPVSAATTISTLSADPSVVSAGVYTREGHLFAQYLRQNDNGIEEHSLPSAIAPASVNAMAMSWSDDPGIVSTQPIVFRGDVTGYVRIRSDLRLLRARISRYVLIVAVVLAGSLVAAFGISRVAQRSITSPIVALARFAEGVARDRDYAVRVQPIGDAAEFAVLTTAFNDMLAEIEYRDASLRASHDDLERRVDERTAELTAVNQELEAFSYSVSHDLRAPLRHVSGFVALLRSHAGSSLDAQSQRYLATIGDASSRMGQLIDDLLAFSRVSRTTLAKSQVDLDALVREAQAEVMAEVSGRDIAWTIRPLPSVQADPALLRLVVVNLLSNAVKYTKTRAHACIEVSATHDGRETVLSVADNGVGFDMQYAHKLFGVFQRLHRLEEFEGTGIGLANVRRIVQRHGGRVWAESQIDRGATFYVALPTERLS